MIRQLEDLSHYSQHLESFFKDPIHKEKFRFYLPGISKKEECFIKDKLQNLSESYLNIASKYNLLTTVIGYFVCSPGVLYHSLENALIEANDDPFFPKEFMEKHGMYQIGSYNTDLICLTSGTDEFEEGEILFVEEGEDIYNPQDDQIHILSKDFEQFLIIAGNLSQVHHEIKEDNSNYEEKRLEFIERMNKLGVDQKYHQAWLAVF